jgi:putative transposase
VYISVWYNVHVKVRYTYRLRPGATAERYLAREWGMCRYVWNQLVAESKARHAADPAATFGYGAQDKFLTHLRASTRDEDDIAWLAAGSSVAQQQTVRDFSAARTKALRDRKARIPVARRRGLPRFKKRDVALLSMNYTLRGFSLRTTDTGTVRLVLPGGVSIPVVWSRDLPSPPKSVRVSQDSLGHWYASFVVEVEHTALPAMGDGIAIGIDWGVTETATTVRVNLHTGEVDEGIAFDLPHHQHGKNAAAEFARAQRKMARRRRPKGSEQSHGYRLAKRQTAKVAKKVARQRADDAHKWAKNLVAAHDQIAVEDFKPKFLAKSTMARKAADAAIAATKTALIWQALKAERQLELVHPRHTTMECGNCGARTKHRLPLGQRTYSCESCEHVRPRDKNSATVMVTRAGFDPADVEGVRPEPTQWAQAA